MKNLPLIIAAAFFAIMGSAYGGLDDTGEKKVTVGSEIARGDAAAEKVELELEWWRFSLNAKAVIDHEKQRQTDSEGFLLGAYHVMSKRLLWLANEETSAKYNTTEDLRNARGMAAAWFAKFRDLQQQLKLSDLDIATALGGSKPEYQQKAVAQLQEEAQTFARIEQQNKAEKQIEEDRKAKEAAVAEQARKAQDENARQEQERERVAIIKAKLPQLVKESQTRALKAHPDLGKSGSPLNVKFVEAFKTLQSENSTRLQTPDWPEKLADECDAGSSTVANR